VGRGPKASSNGRSSSTSTGICSAISSFADTSHNFQPQDEKKIVCACLCHTVAAEQIYALRGEVPSNLRSSTTVVVRSFVAVHPYRTVSCRGRAVHTSVC
jgi:hypothetical protein